MQMQVQDLADVWLDSDHASTAGLACIHVHVICHFGNSVLSCPVCVPVILYFLLKMYASRQIRNTAENCVSNVGCHNTTIFSPKVFNVMSWVPHTGAFQQSWARVSGSEQA